MRRLSTPWPELPNCANISGDFPEKVPNGWLPIYGSLQVIPSGTTHTFKHFQSSLKCRNRSFHHEHEQKNLDTILFTNPEMLTLIGWA